MKKLRVYDWAVVIVAAESLLLVVLLIVAVVSRLLSTPVNKSKMAPLWYVENKIYAHIRAEERKLEPQFYIDEKIEDRKILKFGKIVNPPTTTTVWYEDAEGRRLYDAVPMPPDYACETTGGVVRFLMEPDSGADVLFEKELKSLSVSEYCIYDGYIGFCVRELGLSVKESGDSDGIVWVERSGDVRIAEPPPAPLPTRSPYA